MPAPTSAAHAGDLWATVNICDTERNPNVLGVRASMPGNGTTQTMSMRFRASYFDRSTERWCDVGGTAARRGSTSATRAIARRGGPQVPHRPSAPHDQPRRAWRRRLPLAPRPQDRPARDAEDPERPPHGPPRRPARLLGRDLRDHLPLRVRPFRKISLQIAASRERGRHPQPVKAVAPSKRRGSFVITPCTPIASSRAIFFASSTVHT